MTFTLSVSKISPMIIDCIREGIKLANRNLPLVLIRIAVAVINIGALVILIGVPLLVAMSYLDVAFEDAGDLWPGIVDDPFEVASKYLGLTVLIIISVILYLLFSSMLFLYALGGTLATLKVSFLNSDGRFNLAEFFREAHRNFSRLLWLLSLVSLVIIAAVLLLVVLCGIAVVVAHSGFGAGSMLEVFIHSFLAVFLSIVAIIIFLGAFLFATYAVILSIIEGKGAVDTARNTFSFLWERPHAILFFIVLLAGTFFVSLIFYGLQIPIRFLPVMSPFLGLFFYIVNAFFHSYIVIVLWSSLTVYYVRKTGYPVYHTGYEI